MVGLDMPGLTIYHRRWKDLNFRPPWCKHGTLPTELNTRLRLPKSGCSQRDSNPLLMIGNQLFYRINYMNINPRTFSNTLAVLRLLQPYKFSRIQSYNEPKRSLGKEHDPQEVDPLPSIFTWHFQILYLVEVTGDLYEH